jgi:hypothetical protein
MGMRMGELEPRQQERLRAALAEALAAHFAYPAFYSFRADRPLIRPLDRAKRQEIASYAGTVGFAPLEPMEVDSAELRRYFEGVFLRYLDVNPHLSSPRMAERRPYLRALARRVSADVQGELLAYLQGHAPTFGASQPPVSWAEALAQATPPDAAAIEHNTAVLQAILARTRQQTPANPRRPAAPPASPPAPSGGAARPHELPPELVHMYGQYLSDMQPEVATRGPAKLPVVSRGQPAGSGDDLHVFSQLRYQLEAYIRRAVRGYGLPDRGGDPARALDDLRASGLVDEANLRLVEGILALTDRVTARGSASIEDYRQALLLYLLYHRSHLGA